MCTSSARPTGFTLIELIIFIVVVSIGIVGILGVMNYTTRHSADPMIQKQALAIAESLLEEIELKDFSKPAGGFPGPYTLANRQSFDAVIDYNGYANPPGIVDLNNNSIAGLGDYSANVSVTNAALGGIPVADAVLISVTVTHASGQSWTLSGYRSNYAQ